MDASADESRPGAALTWKEKSPSGARGRRSPEGIGTRARPCVEMPLRQETCAEIYGSGSVGGDGGSGSGGRSGSCGSSRGGDGRSGREGECRRRGGRGRLGRRCRCGSSGCGRGDDVDRVRAATWQDDRGRRTAELRALRRRAQVRRDRRRRGVVPCSTRGVTARCEVFCAFSAGAEPAVVATTPATIPSPLWQVRPRSPARADHGASAEAGSA
jgi:hypothetical protein